MIPAQPHNISAYVSDRSTSRLRDDIARRYYLSWEDALWDLCERLPIRSETRVLIPDFWCRHVIQNMSAHGMICHHYPVDDSFQTDEATLTRKIHEINPGIIVIFHAVGIHNRLLREHIGWIHTLRADQILLEDCVHSVIDPSEVTLLHSAHVVIDSWRKVVPLQGSCMYLPVHMDRQLGSERMRISVHELVVVTLWALMQIGLMAQNRSGGIVGHFMGLLAECMMIVGYALIGIRSHPSGTPALFVRLAGQLDTRKIQDAKRRQVALYESRLQSLVTQREHAVWRRPSDDGLLRGYPIRLHKDTSHRFLGRIRAQGLILRHELDDSPWSRRHKVIYLPLGPHLTDDQINVVCDVIEQSLQGE